MTIDEEVGEKDLKEVIQHIFVNESYTNLDIKTAPGSNVGDGFLGVNTAVTVTIDDSIKQLFIKGASRNMKVREAMAARTAFVREVHFFTNVVPVLEEQYAKHTKRHLTLTAKCYFSSDEDLKEILVMENLISEGFKLIKVEYFDREHLMLVLKTYSRLHAIGFTLRKDNPSVLKKFEKDIPNLLPFYSKHFNFDKLNNNFIDILKNNCDKVKDRIILDKIDVLKESISNVLSNDPDCGEYSTVIQVDCWRNNVMFKYDSNDQPEDIRLLDFQVCTISLPVFDVLHTFYTNGSSEENLADMDFFMDYYYTNLSREIKEMGGDVNVLYPYDIFQQHLKKYGVYGFGFALNVVRALLAKPNEMPNIVELLKNGVPTEELMNFKIAAEEEYSKRIKAIVYHLIKRNVI